MKVQVWNKNTYTYKETFKDDPIEVPAGGFVTMEEDDAIQFLGTYAPMKLLADNTPDPKYFKMLRIVKDSTAPAPTPQADLHVCNACKYKAGSAKDLTEHSKIHADTLVSDDALDKEIAAKKKAG